MAPLDLGERDLQDVTLRIGFTDQLSQGRTSLDKDNVVIQTLDVAAKLIGRCTGGSTQPQWAEEAIKRVAIGSCGENKSRRFPMGIRLLGWWGGTPALGFGSH